MFRRLPNSLPKDTIVPADLQQLGYFVNNDDQIRMIRNPEQKYQYRINRDDRVNDVHKNALNMCLRQIAHQRLTSLGLEIMRLPIGAQQDERHVPVLVSKDLKRKRRVVVIFGERNTDLGISSYRVIGDQGINAGSAVDMVDAIINGPTVTSGDDAPGVILANPGQLLWFRGGGRAISDNEWLSLPRESAVHEPYRIDPIKNRAPGNRDYIEHVQYLFENVMTTEVDSGATFDIVGLEYTGMAVIHYLADHWESWSHRISGICLGQPQHALGELEHNPAFLEFVERRARAYLLSDALPDSPMPGREKVGCNCYASGEEFYEDKILTKSWRSMLDWFNMTNAVKDYKEPVLLIYEDVAES